MTLVTGDAGAPEDALTFEAFARVIGKSRPYVSKLVAQGRIRPPALTPERKILPAQAQEQIAEGADPARSGGSTSRDDGDATYAANRARKTLADAAKAELDLAERRGQLVERSAISATLAPLFRRLRDELVMVPQQVISDAEVASRCEEALSTALEKFSSEILAHGGAGPAG